MNIKRMCANALGCSFTDIACRRAAHVKTLNASAPVTPGTTITTLNKFQPYIDGEIIPAEPLKVGSKVPLLSGTNSMEGTLFVVSQSPDPRMITQTDYTTFLQSNFGSLASIVGKAYPLSFFVKYPYPAFSAISTVITYNTYFCPTRHALLATLNFSIPVWNYNNAHTLTCGWEPGLGGVILRLLGSTHTSQIPFVFAHLGNLPPPTGACSFDTQELAISEVFTSAWTSMAATGSPDGGRGVLGGPWPLWNGTASLGLLIGNISAVGYINYTVCDLWDRIEAAKMDSAMSGNWTLMGNATLTGGASVTSSGLTTTATGEGNTVQTPFFIALLAAAAVVFRPLASF